MQPAMQQARHQKFPGHWQCAESVELSSKSSFQEVESHAKRPCNKPDGRDARATGRGLKVCNCCLNQAFKRWQGHATSHATSQTAEQPVPPAGGCKCVIDCRLNQAFRWWQSHATSHAKSQTAEVPRPLAGSCKCVTVI